MTSLSNESLNQAVRWLDNEPSEDLLEGPLAVEKALSLLTSLLQAASIKCSSLDELSTASLDLLSVSYHLARAHLKLPYQQAGSFGHRIRRRNLLAAMDHFHAYWKQLENLPELLRDSPVAKDYASTLDQWDSLEQEQEFRTSQSREKKIQRYQRTRTLSQTVARLQSSLQRRQRLNLGNDDELDGYDLESLLRELYIQRLKLFAESTVEELQSSMLELQMLNMAIQNEETDYDANNSIQDSRKRYSSTGPLLPSQTDATTASPAPNSPLQLTQITQDPITGQLTVQKQQLSKGAIQNVDNVSYDHGTATLSLGHTFKRQQIADSVFRPGWNQPTMTLEELATMEREQAIQRSQAQKEADAQTKFQPRRYDQLVRDGMEDNERLVELSAKLDREWDEWKEQNPRGSGNKMGERGDRNF